MAFYNEGSSMFGGPNGSAVTLYDLFAPTTSKPTWEPYRQPSFGEAPPPIQNDTPYGSQTISFDAPSYSFQDDSGAIAPITPQDDSAGNGYEPSVSERPLEKQKNPLIEKIFGSIVGANQYKGLPDEARKIATHDALSVLGQQLMMAAIAPSKQEYGAMIVGAIPVAQKAFKESLSNQQKMIKEAQDEAYQTEKRNREIAGWKREDADRSEQDNIKQIGSEVAASALNDQISLAKSWSNDPDVRGNPKAAARLGDLKMFEMQLNRINAAGLRVPPELVNGINKAVNDIAEAAGKTEELHQKAAEHAYQVWVDNGAPGTYEEWVNRQAAMAGHKFTKAEADANRAVAAAKKAETDAAKSASLSAIAADPAKRSEWEAQNKGWLLSPDGKVVRAAQERKGNEKVGPEITDPGMVPLVTAYKVAKPMDTANLNDANILTLMTKSQVFDKIAAFKRDNPQAKSMSDAEVIAVLSEHNRL